MSVVSEDAGQDRCLRKKWFILKEGTYETWQNFTRGT